MEYVGIYESEAMNELLLIQATWIKKLGTIRSTINAVRD